MQLDGAHYVHGTLLGLAERYFQRIFNTCRDSVRGDRQMASSRMIKSTANDGFCQAYLWVQ